MSAVTLHALIARINRKLAHQGEQLRTLRGDRHHAELGRYYAVDVRGNYVTANHVDPKAWGRELGVLPEGVEVRQ